MIFANRKFNRLSIKKNLINKYYEIEKTIVEENNRFMFI